MCGICGFTRQMQNTSSEHDTSLCDMVNALRHRGPDDEGIFMDADIALGARRLKIIDLIGGKQPLTNESGSVVVVFNGEIYNYKELRDELLSKGHVFNSQSDTEIIPHLYEEYGITCFDRLNGMFAIAIWDHRLKRLVLARDRFGIKPLYYAEWHSDIVFSSEIKSLIQFKGLDKSMDLLALDQFLTYQYIPTPRSIFSHIKKLPPAHYLIWEESGMVIKRYWELPQRNEEMRGITDADAEEMVRDLVKRSISRRLMSDVPLGFLLSGGIDSSALTALAQEVGGKNIKTFSIGFDEESFDESHDSRLVARYLGTEHYEDIFTRDKFTAVLDDVIAVLDEPFADPSIFPTFFLSQFAKQHVTVALGGEGGDELFAGYPQYRVIRHAQLYKWMPLWLRKMCGSKIPSFLPVNLQYYSIDYKIRKFLSGLPYAEGERNIVWLGAFTPQEKEGLFVDNIAQYVDEQSIFEPVKAYTHHLAYRDRVTRAQYFDMKTYLMDDLLVKVDRASMAHSLEVRVPYLDHELVECVLNLPLHLRLRGLHTKHILKKIVAEHVPKPILAKHKKGFAIPAALWIKGPLQKKMTEVLLDRAHVDGLFNTSFIEKLLNEHVQGKQNNYRQLWALFMFSLWKDKYGV